MTFSVNERHHACSVVELGHSRRDDTQAKGVHKIRDIGDKLRQNPTNKIEK